MRLGKETRRTLAQFLNALAVALLATMVLGPLASGALDADVALVTIAAAGILHGAALKVVRGDE